MSKIEKCEDCFIGQSLKLPSLTGLLFQESEKHLYMINPSEYVRFNFCPRCGYDLHINQLNHDSHINHKENI